MKADMAEFVLDMLYMIDGDSSKRTGDVRIKMKEWGI